MASKIELTISPNYVPSWTIVDAIRELFQNALDQEKQCPGNDMGWEYDSTEEKLYITNKSSTLTAQSLLLGQTTKANDSSTIGQFGEGYKIATLVLLRNDKQITFYNYGAKEIWRPRFVKSRKFKTDILTFFIEKVSMWDRIPDNNLTLEISNISEDEWLEEIKPSNLHLRDDYEVIQSTQYGDVINLPGKIFVNGLYVCDYAPYEYGYNFKPGEIKLDRDRKMVSDFDLRWVASKVWCDTKQNDLVFEMLDKGTADVAYLNDVYGNITHWRDTVAQHFKDVYGPEAIPVTTQDELESIPAGYKGVVVSQSYNNLVRARISIPSTPDPDDPKVKLQEFFDDLVMRYDIAHEDVEAFNKIMEDL